MLEAEKEREFSDEELILKYRDGEEGVIGHIMDKYKNLVRKKAGSMFILGGDRDDLIQEGMIGLFKAVRDYDTGRDVSFFTFADLCISRQMYTAVQASTRQKHFPLNTYISLYSHYAKDMEEGQEGEELLNALEGGPAQNPEEMFLEQERVAWLEAAIAAQLSPLEKQVLDLHITGMTYTEIAKVLGRDEKSTDNALQRIKHKLRRILEEKEDR